MSRRHAAEKREVLPDIKYNSVLLAKFINKVVKDGKKSLAEKLVYKALEKIEKTHRVDPFEAFSNAMDNVKPSMEVTSVRVGGANYQVPAIVSEGRGYTLAARWILESANKRVAKSMIDKLAEELFEAANSRGGAIKKRDDTYKMVEANKAFSHFSPRKSQES